LHGAQRPGWHTYRNHKYRYEIAYPEEEGYVLIAYPEEGYVLRAEIGGEEDAGDGADLWIGLEGKSAVHGLSLHVSPRATLPEIMPTGELSDIDILTNEVSVNGVSGQEILHRFRSTGELVFADVFLKGIVFHLVPWPRTDADDLHETIWWEILSTFRSFPHRPADRGEENSLPSSDEVLVFREETVLVAGPLHSAAGESCLASLTDAEFALGRIRVGEFGWFPSLVLPSENLDESDLRPYLGREVMIRGYGALVPIHPPIPMAIDRISAVVAETVVPVENRAQEVFRGLPGAMNYEGETTVRLGIKNPLPCALDMSRIIVDLDGVLQFKDGERAQYTTQHREVNWKLRAHESRRLVFTLIPATLERNQNQLDGFAMSVMFLGYCEEEDAMKPAFAFWKREWKRSSSLRPDDSPFPSVHRLQDASGHLRVAEVRRE